MYKKSPSQATYGPIGRRWSSFLKLSAPAYTVKPVIVSYPHLFIHRVPDNHSPTYRWMARLSWPGWLVK